MIVLVLLECVSADSATDEYMTLIGIAALVIIFALMVYVKRTEDRRAQDVKDELKRRAVEEKRKQLAKKPAPRTYEFKEGEREELAKEVERISKREKRSARGEKLRQEYWQKIDTVLGTDSEDELTKFRSEHDHLKGLIKLAEEKYHNHEIDEETFREIVKDYQKKLIELETRMNRVQKG